MVLKTRWKQFNEMLAKSSKRQYSKSQILRLFIDFMWTRLTKGVYLIDYIQYKFYDRNQLSRDTFMEYQKLHRLIEKVNDESKAPIFNSKFLFNQTFDKHLNRDWFDARIGSFDQFVNFAKNKEEIIIKPDDGSFGMGIRKIKVDQIDFDEVYKEIVYEKALVEDVVIQHPDLVRLNPSSLNTLRVVTMIDQKGQPHVMTTVLRIGRFGKVTDNFHSQGLAVLVDVESGILSTTAIDRDFERYIHHPDSGVKLIGLQVPSWDKVISKALELAMVVPQVRYVGWDLAIDHQGKVLCIEGNYSADPDVTQTTDQVGKYHRFKEKI